MLSAADDDLLCRTGPGTPMGNMVRRFWVPFPYSSEQTFRDQLDAHGGSGF